MARRVNWGKETRLVVHPFLLSRSLYHFLSSFLLCLLAIIYRFIVLWLVGRSIWARVQTGGSRSQRVGGRGWIEICCGHGIWDGGIEIGGWENWGERTPKKTHGLHWIIFLASILSVHVHLISLFQVLVHILYSYSTPRTDSLSSPPSPSLSIRHAWTTHVYLALTLLYPSQTHPHVYTSRQTLSVDSFLSPDNIFLLFHCYLPQLSFHRFDP